jgi:HAD superfamily hydrolase (TIGR01549 family)
MHSLTFIFSITLTVFMSDNYTLLQRKYWIFDLDGTLTVAVHDFNVIRNELGIPAGQPILKTIESLPENESLALQQKLQDIEENLARNSKPAQGVKNLLEALHLRNYHLGILTLNSRENAWLTLEALDLADYFNADSVIGRWCAEPKPSPKGIHRLLNHWQVAENDTLIVGDYLYDLQVGRAAEIATIHVDPKGEFSWPELADIQVNSLAELADLLAEHS